MQATLLGFLPRNTGVVVSWPRVLNRMWATHYDGD